MPFDQGEEYQRLDQASLESISNQIGRAMSRGLLTARGQPSFGVLPEIEHSRDHSEIQKNIPIEPVPPDESATSTNISLSTASEVAGKNTLVVDNIPPLGECAKPLQEPARRLLQRLTTQIGAIEREQRQEIADRAPRRDALVPSNRD